MNPVSRSGKDLIRFLEIGSGESEQNLEADWILQLEVQKKKLESYPESFLSKKISDLQFFRARLSNSLAKSKEAIQNWNKAQEVLDQWLCENRTLNLGDLQHLNQILNLPSCDEVPRIPDLEWRKVDVFTTQVKHPAPEDLPTMMKSFWDHLENVIASKHPVYAACVCRYWILSIHPFQNGNGRTSQLFADYYLMRAGFPPQSFKSQLQGNLIGDPQKKSFLTPHEAFRRFCQTIVNSFEILTEIKG